MSVENITESLRKTDYLRDLSDEQYQALAEIAAIVDYPAQKEIFGEFETSKDVYVILGGEVSVVVCLDSVGCRQLASVSGGELLGWSPLLERGRLSATAVTKTPTQAIAINGHKLAALCKEKPELGFELMSRTAQVLADRLYATRLQLLELSGSHFPQVALESD